MSKFSIKGNFSHLVDVIDAVVKMTETASEACILEIRQKLSLMKMDAEAFALLCTDVKAFDRFEKDSREYNAKRMEAFSEHVSSDEIALHAAGLDFKERSNGNQVAECQAFTLTDESTISNTRYAARYSSMFNQLWSYFIQWSKEDAEEAFEALSEDDASARIRGWYQAKLEAEAEEKRETDKSENASGEGETEQLDKDAPEYAVELWNATESLKRVARALYRTDEEAAAEPVTEATAKVHQIIRELQAAGAEMDSGESKAA